jgi:hypothetical protein
MTESISGNKLPQSQSWWHKVLGRSDRSILKALIGTHLDLSDRQTAGAVVALAIIGTLCALAFMYEDFRGDIVKTLSGVIFVIIGFYFGEKRNNSSDNEDQI